LPAVVGRDKSVTYSAAKTLSENLTQRVGDLETALNGTEVELHKSQEELARLGEL